MSFEEKLNTVIKEIGEVYHLTPGALNNIKKNIIVRNNMYKEIQPNINKDETTFIKDTNSVGDVLINRLINNIRNYDLLTEFNPNIVTKGTYTGQKQTLYLESYSSIKAAILDKLQDRIQKVDDNTLKKAVSKVFDHELGHALQKSFTGIKGFNDQNFKELVNRLTTKYPTVFEAKYQNEELQTIQAGMIPKRKDGEKSQIRKFYSRVAYTTHLDEIFNDSEALETTDTKTAQLKYDFGNGLKQDIYNYDSSYYRITNQAYMMKLLMGKERTYRSMYEDSIHTYEFFDQFIEESNSVFQGSKYKAPMLNILNSMEEAKNKRSVEASLKLDLFFISCLKRKIAHELRNPNIDMPKIQELVQLIKDFDKRMVKSNDHRLSSEKIMDSIKKRVEDKYDSLTTRYQEIAPNSSNIQQPSSNDYTAIKDELSTIKSRYNEMLSDNVIDNEELNELINRMKNLDKKVLDKIQETTTEKEKAILIQISDAIYKEKNKMEKFQMSIERINRNNEEIAKNNTY